MGASATPLNKSGQWGTTPVELGFSGTHVALLRKPGTDSASVFLFGESGTPQTMKLWRFVPNDDEQQLPAPATLFELPHPNQKRSDLFCSGHVTLPDGKLLLVGGAWIPDTVCQNVYTLDPAWTGPDGTTPWTQDASMAVERWYASVVALADGRAAAISGNSSSQLSGFGGRAFDPATVLDSTWRVLQTLDMAGRFAWAETTAVPGNNPPTGPRVRNDTKTFGEYPLSRDGHAFVGDPSGRGVLLYGRHREPGPVDVLLSDAWFMEGSIAGDDTTHTWRRFQQVGDASLPGTPMPVPRYAFAATWAGVERSVDGMEALADDQIACYLHGGIASDGHVLGDLWRGHKEPSGSTYYNWVWQQLLPDLPATARRGTAWCSTPARQIRTPPTRSCCSTAAARRRTRSPTRT